MNGKVYLIGAGPGDPGLITVKGLACIQQADVVIYDYLAAPTLLAHATGEAEIIYVGKKGSDHTLSQDGINALIVEKAMQGKVVARLKGGDPFIFGRGGEEAEVLVQNGIDFEIVPGVTSAIAAPAYAGIPLTHRQFTSTLAFVTGHEDPTKDETQIDWSALANGIGTLVFLMGVKNLPNIARRLIEKGKPPDTPVALVRWGTTPKQVTVTGTLDTIVDRVKAAGLKAPAIIIVGRVVELRPTLKWFETRPLMGKTILVTRARAQASDMVKMLSDLGASCLEYPTIEIVAPDSWEPMDESIQDLSRYDWLVFTSVNGVKFFFDRLFHSGLDSRALNGIQTATIGPATEKRLAGFGVKSDIVPESYRAESIIKAFKDKNIDGKRILLPRAAEARPILPVELTQMGATVDEITAYCTRIPESNQDLLLDHLRSKTVDFITFTSSSTVKNFKALLPPEQFDDLMDGVTIASIGPITTDTANALGFDVHIDADPFTIPDLCKAMVQYSQENG
ncbi:MAG: uroporphyrinogen-III C-methyltransferase [Desulfobacterales bacterium]